MTESSTQSAICTAKLYNELALQPILDGHSMPARRSDILRFTSHRHLRQRLLLSILSGKSIRVDQIRSDDVHVGLRDYEVNLLRLVEKVTNGSTIEISVTGTFHTSNVVKLIQPRYIIPLPPRSASRGILHPHMSCRQINRLLPRSSRSSRAVLQESI